MTKIVSMLQTMDPVISIQDDDDGPTEDSLMFGGAEDDCKLPSSGKCLDINGASVDLTIFVV